MEETNNTPNTVVVDALMVEPIGDASQVVEAEVCYAELYESAMVEVFYNKGSAQTLTLQSKFQKHLEEVELDGERTDADKYMEELCEKVTSNFDIWNWWKVNSSKYKVILEVARDVLAILMSTISSEAAFSMGGRVMD
ncbi:hypothetical protein Acr_03g0014750 [Actinidia rufa]|uniref:HAT C-terminal dimerisation domain-containing protein n=1 Tax=Actinidia rufa TaxID=165716 RepID=A0A7J0EDY9_9ERIC|nr:hypothetical protein Acr_03g0014750 [Actinidia rufa]